MSRLLSLASPSHEQPVNGTGVSIRASRTSSKLNRQITWDFLVHALRGPLGVAQVGSQAENERAYDCEI
jgi:hypothetical protein